MKQKDFVFNLCFLLFLNLLIKPFWILGIDVGVQNHVGASAYGTYFAIFNFTFMFNILLDMGTTNFNNRNIAQNRQLLDKHLSGIIVLRFLLGIVYLFIVFLVAHIIGYRGFMLTLLFWTAINQFLNTFLLYLRSNVSALMLFKTDSILSVLDRVLMILFCGILLWNPHTQQQFCIEWFVWCQTAAYLCAILVSLTIVLRKAHLQKLHWNPIFYVAILKKSLPFATLTLLMACYNRIDSVMIERILPASISSTQAGIYASAFRLLDALVMIAYLFSVILLPLFSKMIKERENILPIVRTSFSLLYFFSISTVVILLYNKQPILSWLYHDHITESIVVFSWLIPCIIPIAFTYVFGTLLTANGSLKKLNITALIGIGINIIINVLLIPILHAKGAAIASLCTQSVVSLLQCIIALHAMHIPVRTLPWIATLIFTIILIPTIHLIVKFLPCSLLSSLIISSVIALLIGIASQLINIKEFKTNFILKRPH